MKKTIVFTGGGTLGHVMPCLYLINELRTDYNCYYIGSNGIEKEMVEKQLKNFYTIPAVKLVRGKILTNLKIPFVLVDAIFKAKKILKQLKPSVVFSKGGYVSLPVCVAAKMLKVPIIAHESDYSFGLANKIILTLCNKMCVNFKHLQDNNKKVVYSGPILDKSFDSNIKSCSNLKLVKNKPTILIVGGSLGSRLINNLIVELLPKLLPQFNIIHITGKGNLKQKSFDNYNAFEMYKDMPQLYNISTFLIGRSGAGVTAECFYKKLPMLLIPLENSATRGDQYQNAKYYQNLGVAKIVRENELTSNQLYKAITDFATNLNKYNDKYKTLPNTNGREIVLKQIKQFLN